MDIKKAIQFGNRLRHGSVTSGFSLSKAKSGVYADTPENKKKGVVGQKYGNTAKKEDPTQKKTAKPEEQSKPSGGAKPQENKSKPSPGGEQPQVGGHEVAQLTHLKSVLASDPQKAYEMYQELTPEAQAIVPQDVVNKMVQGHHSQEEPEGPSFDKLGEESKEGEEEAKLSSQEISSIQEEVYSKINTPELSKKFRTLVNKKLQDSGEVYTTELGARMEREALSELDTDNKEAKKKLESSIKTQEAKVDKLAESEANSSNRSKLKTEGEKLGALKKELGMLNGSK